MGPAKLLYAVWAQGIDVAGWLVGAMVTIALGGKLTKTLNENSTPSGSSCSWPGAW